MKIGGWRTRRVFERYAIVSQADIVEALQKYESPDVLGLYDQIQAMVSKDPAVPVLEIPLKDQPE